jgi:hypothetical protein
MLDDFALKNNKFDFHIETIEKSESKMQFSEEQLERAMEVLSRVVISL